MKSIVTKLVIYKKDPRFDYCPTPYYCEGYFVGGGQFCSYCGITDTQAQEKEIENTFIGDDAMREYWAIKFNNLQEQDRKLILSAFPDIESKDNWTIQNYRDLHFRVFRKRGHGYNGDGNNFTRDFTSNNIKNDLNVLPDEKFLQIYSQDGYFARNCERFIFDDYKLACRAAEILNESELARLNKYNAEHGTSFVPIWDKTNDPKN